MRIAVDKEKCKGSGQCIKVCPQGAIEMRHQKAEIDMSKCDLDGICIPACPHGAIYFEEDKT